MEDLVKFIRENKNDIKVRAVIVYLVESGKMKVKEVAKELGIGERTIYEWKRRYREEGVEGLRDRRAEGNQGKRRKLSEEDEERLKELLKAKDRWTPKEVIELIRKEFGVEYSYIGAWKLMRRIGVKGVGRRSRG